MARETTRVNGVELQRQVRPLSRFRALAFELTPLICTILILWYKQVYFALAQMGGLISSSLPEQANYLVLLTATLATIILPASLISLLPRVPRLVALFSLDLIYTTLILADIISIRFYGDILSFMGVTPFRMIRTVFPSIQAQLVPADALLYIDLLAALVFLPFYLRTSRRFPHLSFAYLRRLSAVFLMVGFVSMLPLAKLFSGADRTLAAYRNLHHQLTSSMGFVAYHVWDIN